MKSVFLKYLSIVLCCVQQTHDTGHLFEESSKLDPEPEFLKINGPSDTIILEKRIFIFQKQKDEHMFGCIRFSIPEKKIS